MKRILLSIVALFLLACGPAHSGGPPTPACKHPILFRVENQNFLDMDIRDFQGRRLETVTGLTTKTWLECAIQRNAEAIIYLDPIGSSTARRLQAAQSTFIGAKAVKIVVGPDPRMGLSFLYLYSG